ncbi:hypothetical protein [Georgenia sp. AZ-5]|uniref:hypothetical protein n=1 Tax=Georgenia sp. AZ-5 TaxID=3367526 RepID=UPI0037550178
MSVNKGHGAAKAAANELAAEYASRRDYRTLHALFADGVHALAHVVAAGGRITRTVWSMPDEFAQHGADAAAMFGDRSLIAELRALAPHFSGTNADADCYADLVDEFRAIREVVGDNPGIGQSEIARRVKPDTDKPDWRVVHGVYLLRMAGELVEQVRSGRVYVWLPGDPSAPQDRGREERAAALAALPFPEAVRERIAALTAAWEQLSAWSDGLTIHDMPRYPRGMDALAFALVGEPFCFLDEVTTADLARLWAAQTTTRATPDPDPDGALLRAADTAGPAVLFWVGVLACCHRTYCAVVAEPAINELPAYQHNLRETLDKLGHGVDEAIYVDLMAADERHQSALGDDQYLEGEALIGQLRSSFSELLQVIGSHRRRWDDRHLAAYFETLWRTDALAALDELRTAEHAAAHLTRARRNKIIKHCANRWFGGDADVLAKVLGLPEKVPQLTRR